MKPRKECLRECFVLFCFKLYFYLQEGVVVFMKEEEEEEEEASVGWF